MSLYLPPGLEDVLMLKHHYNNPRPPGYADTEDPQLQKTIKLEYLIPFNNIKILLHINCRNTITEHPPLNT